MKKNHNYHHIASGSSPYHQIPEKSCLFAKVEKLQEILSCILFYGIFYCIRRFWLKMAFLNIKYLIKQPRNMKSKRSFLFKFIILSLIHISEPTRPY